MRTWANRGGFFKRCALDKDSYPYHLKHTQISYKEYVYMSDFFITIYFIFNVIEF